MEEASKGMKSDSAIATTTTEICGSPRINNLHHPLGQKEPSPIQSKDDTVQASGHKDDAHMDETDQALCPGIYRSKEERIPDNKRMHELSENHSPSNIPSKKFRTSESNPQDLQMPKVVLNMANDESDKLMPAKFLMTDQARKVESKIIAGPSMDHSEDDKIVLHKLFEKSLTPSDVGNLYRFVIPKKHALDYFPDVKNTDKTVLLEFVDNQKKRWKFRYSYWTSSQTFVLTKGWSQFVKEKGLDEKDVVVFYRFGEEQDGHKDQYYMIDIIPFDNGSDKVILREHADETIENPSSQYSSDTTETSMEEKMEEEIPQNILTRGQKGVEEAAEKSSAGEQEVMKVEDEGNRDKTSLIRSQEMNLEDNSLQGKEQVEATDMKQEGFKEGVWLFGVQISP